jgi:NADPH-dependent 2,4-dienoyl-CoA reductase/sulfur reductase-like enzyme
MHVVIVGNGVAGMEAAMTVRAREAEEGRGGWRITVVSEETDHFFSRTALMYVLSGQLSYQGIEPLERDAYARLRVERVRGRAVGLDPAAKQLELADGGTVAYDRLLLACGSRPREGPWEGYGLRGVGHFVTMQDLQWLEQELHGRSGVDLPPRADAHLPTAGPVNGSGPSPYAAREVAARVRGTTAKRAVVIGGGLIGVEVIETLLAARRAATFLLKDEWFWPIALDRNEATFIAGELRHHGVDVRTGENVLRLEGDAQGNVARVVTGQGAIDTDLVVIAIGVRPNTDWCREVVPLDPSGAIRVDEGLRTSLPDVWACGDCAAVRWFDGRVRPEQLWYTARDQGRVAGRGLLGDEVRYSRGTWYNSAKLMDVEYTTAGLVNMKIPGEASVYFEEKGRVRSTTRVVHVDGRVIGMNFLGRRWDHGVCVRWIEERRTVGYVLERLHEASFDTEFVPRLEIPRSVWPG